jgi:hypothetical protein
MAVAGRTFGRSDRDQSALSGRWRACEVGLVDAETDQATPRSTYPARVEGELREPLSRWLWLVKWVLAIPHYVVLWFLWIVYLLLTIVALVSIVFTRRYPRGIFEFNVGVLRWSWRVAFYSYGALGTDRYPPFSLQDDPDYPARLHVAYPGELSRVQALVKWWLLAIPHYLVIAVFLGGFDTGWSASRFGLIDIAVLIAGVSLLFTSRYPRGLFDLTMGANRWVLRVVVYASLMTDVYPPFRLDQGARERAPMPVTEHEA